MTKLMEEIEARIQEVGGNYWHMNMDKAKKIVTKMTASEANDFMAEVFAKLKSKKFDHGDVLLRFMSSLTDFWKLVEADAIDEFVNKVIDTDSIRLDILQTITQFENLSIETIKAIMEYSKSQNQRYQSCHDDSGDYIGSGSEPDIRFPSNSVLCELCEHKAMTQEYLDTLASESSESFLYKVAERTTNPATLMRCAKLASKNKDNDYYTLDTCINNKITTAEMLAEIAALSDECGAKVLSSRKCPKGLLAELAKTASGDSAAVILQSGKTPIEILEALVDANNDPNVLGGLASNRSKKVPASLLMKAYAKIPNGGYYYIKQRFLKRGDFADVVSTMAQQVTGLTPTYVEPADPDIADDPDDSAEGLVS